eukprot:scaffold280724_cov38-Prasinocladus_malaysianus.AAC.1
MSIHLEMHPKIAFKCMRKACNSGLEPVLFEATKRTLFNGQRLMAHWQVKQQGMPSSTNMI